MWMPRRVVCGEPSGSTCLVRESTHWTFRSGPNFPTERPRPTPRAPRHGSDFPAARLGGMNPRTANPSLWQEPYDFSPSLDRVTNVPMLTWSTKSFTARWNSSTTAFPQADLIEEDQALAGAVTNTLPFPLEQCFLAHGSYVYQLGTLAPGASAAIGTMTRRSELKTLLNGWKVVIVKKGENFRQEATPYDHSSDDVPYILRTMMFYDAAGGRRYTGLWNDYQQFVDLTDLLKANRAILVAQAPGNPQKSHGATLLCDGRPSTSNPAIARPCTGLSIPVRRANRDVAATNHGPLTTGHSPPSHNDQNPRPHESLRRPTRRQEPHAGPEPRATCSGSSAPTARARPRRCASWPRSCSRPGARPASAATRSTPIPRKSAG